MDTQSSNVVAPSGAGLNPGSFRQAILNNAVQWFAGSLAFRRQLHHGFYLSNIDRSPAQVAADLEKQGVTVFAVTGEILNRQSQLLWEQAAKKSTFGKPFASKMELDLWGGDVVLIDNLEVPEDYPQLWYLYNYLLYPRFATGKPTVVTAQHAFDEYLNLVHAKHRETLNLRRETTPEKLAWLMKASLIDSDDCAYLSSLELPPMLKPEFALYKALKERGMEPKPQHVVADLMLDMAIIEGKNKLAIQCNGSTTIEAYKRRSQEAQINNILFSQGWQILKFSSSEVSDNLPQCIEAIEELFAGGTKKSVAGRWVVAQKQDDAGEEMPGDDEIQTAAATAGGGPAAVTGGAGTGKSTCILKRAAYLSAQGISPEKILILSRSAETRGSIKQKLETELDRQTALRFSCHTFDDIGLRIIKEHLPLLQHKGPIKIDNSPHRTIARVLNKYRKDQDALTNQQTSALDEFALVKQFALYKRNLVSAPQVKAGAKNESEAFAADVFQNYEDELRKANRIDAEDKVTIAAQLLLQHAKLRQQYQAQYEFVLVDEYQDITPAQDVLVRTFAGPADNFMVAGDADEALDQSKGGCMDLLNGISLRIPQTHCFQLEKNWRLRPAVIRCALRVTARLPGWHDHKLGAPVKAAAEVAVQTPVKLPDETAEVEWIAQQCRVLVDSGRDPSQIAVLYQEPKYRNLLEEAITAGGINCEAPGAGSNLVPDEAQDMLSFLKLVADPDGPRTKDAFEKICQLCIKEVDPKLSGIIAAFAAQNNLSYLKAVEIYSEATADQSCRELEQLVRMIRRLHQDKLSPAETITLIRRAYRLNQYYQSVKVPEGVIYEPLRKLTRLEESAYKFHSVEEFVRHQEALKEETGASAVSILAVSDARGKEFPVVFVAGMADGILPAAAAADTDEQRKLCYVALTRSSEMLFISYPEKFNGADVAPSPFLIDAGLVQADPYAKLQKTKAPPAVPAASGAYTAPTPNAVPAKAVAPPPAQISKPNAAPAAAAAECSNCKMPLEPGARFCGECGEQVIAAAQPQMVPPTQPPQPIPVAAQVSAAALPAQRASICSSCSSMLEDGARFCGECGTPAAIAS